MSGRIVSSRLLQRLFDIFIPALSWFLILLPVLLSPFHPAVVAYFILAFNIYFFYKSATTVYYSVLSYKSILYYQKMPFRQKILKIRKADVIRHFIIVPNYKEPLHKLEETIRRITKSDYPHKTLFLVLAFEKREEKTEQKAKILRQKFSYFFRDVIETQHELQPHEVAGKASNQTHAANVVDLYAQSHGIRREDALITISDADSLFPKNYFSYLSYEYIRDKDRMYHFYWAPVFLYNNFWKLPFFVRMQATLSSILRLAFLSKKKKILQ